MNIVMPLYIIASAITVYSPNLEGKAIGFFVQGFLHIKITLCYSHILELVPETHKGFVATVITAFDAGSLAVFGLTLIFVSRNLVKFLEVVNIIESIACLIYLLFAPESPSWLINNRQYRNAIK